MILPLLLSCTLCSLCPLLLPPTCPSPGSFPFVLQIIEQLELSFPLRWVPPPFCPQCLVLHPHIPCYPTTPPVFPVYQGSFAFQIFIWFVTLMKLNNCFGCPKKWNVFLKLCMRWGGGNKIKKAITMKLSITKILDVSCLLSHSIVLSDVCHLISCKSLSFQKCWQTRAMSNLPLWLSKVFTDGPEGTEKIECPSAHRKSFPKLLCAYFSLSGSSQESWASDLGRVREFLMGYMRGAPQPEPMLQLDEVTH